MCECVCVCMVVCAPSELVLGWELILRSLLDILIVVGPSIMCSSHSDCAYRSLDSSTNYDELIQRFG